MLLTDVARLSHSTLGTPLTQPTVSIVVRAYNREAYLGETIASILTQTYEDFELIVWDDGSSDRCLDIAHDYATRDQRVRVVAAQHQGAERSLRDAWAQSRGQYLASLDSDDWLAPTALAETVAVLEAHPEVGLVYTDYYDIDAAGQVLGYGHRCHIPYSRDRLLLDFMTFHFRLIRRTVYDQVGGVDPSIKYVEDYDLCLKLSEVAEVKHIPQPLCYYRQHDGNMSSCYKVQVAIQSRIAIERAIQRRGLGDRFRIELELPACRFYLRPINTVVPRLGRRIPKTNRFAVTLLPLTLLPFTLLSLSPATAQSITPAIDGTGTIITTNGNQYTITGGTQVGGNLFQSFQHFGLSQGQIANFVSHPAIQNILGRVTGGDPSVINGLIQVTGGNSNLYLMNPTGVIFGQNARLDVPGSFTATTANAIGLNGGWFSATGPVDYANLNGSPNQFAFLSASATPGAIVNAGNLAVNSGQSISLIGGTVVNTGTLTAPAGQVLLTAVPSNNLVRLSQPGMILGLEIQPSAASSSTLQLPSLPTPLSLPQLLTGGNLGNATALTVDANGAVVLSGSNQVIPSDGGTAIASGSIDVSTTGNGQTGGSIGLFGQKVGVISGTLNASGTDGGGTVLIGGDYMGQGTLPTASGTFVSADSVIHADALQTGNGGKIILWADDATRFYGTISARGGGTSGNGGFVETSSQNYLAAFGQVDIAAPRGQAGTWLIDPTNITILPGAGTGINIGTSPNFIAGPADISSTIFASTISNALTSGATVIVSTNNPNGTQAGVITLASGAQINSNSNVTIPTLIFEAASGIVIDGSIDMGIPGGYFGNVILRGQGGGSTGFVTVNGSISTNGGSFSSSSNTFNSSSSISTTRLSGTGPSGNLTINATGAISTGDLNTFGDAAGGNLTLTAGTAISTGNLNTFSDAAGGNVSLTAGTAISTGNIATSSVTQAGGTVTLIANTTINTGFIYTQGSTQAGNVLIDPLGDVQVDFIDTSSFGGIGGNITITTASFFRALGTTSFSSSSGGGLASLLAMGRLAGGNITITHGGGLFNYPFMVGGTTSSGVFAGMNGTRAAIATGTFNTPNILQNQSIFGIYSQGTIPGQILIQTVGFPNIEATGQPQPPIELTGDTTPILAPGEAARILRDIERATGKKPAVIYASFFPTVGVTQDDPSLPTTDVAYSNEFRKFLQQSGVQFGLAHAGAIKRQNSTEQSVGALPSEKDLTTGLPSELWRFTATGLSQNLVESPFRPVKPTPKPTDELELVLLTSTGKPVRIRVPGATREKLIATNKAMVLSIVREEEGYRSRARELYNWLVQPLLAELKAQKIDTLLFSMDIGLRSVPIAVLNDGKQFLVEQFSLGLTPSFNLTDSRYQEIKGIPMLAMGASEFLPETNLNSLPAVPVELDSIVGKLWPGTSALNEQFTRTNLQAARQRTPYGIIHLATHAEFRPKERSASYIQLWGQERLRLDQLRQLGWSDPPVELLVLSACKTAIGDEVAELGFAGLAIQAGVKSALGSLWSVSDEGTLAMMNEFYEHLGRKDIKIKAEALRQAQIDMLQGKVSIQDGQLVGVPNSPRLPTNLAEQLGNKNLAHPYYWAGFTMIGSPW